MLAVKPVIIFFALFVPSLCDDPSTDEPVAVPPEPKEKLLEDVNNKRREFAKVFGIPNMHQLVWNETLVEVIGNLIWGHPPPYGEESAILEFESAWDGLEKRWRLIELKTFSDAIPAYNEAVIQELQMNIRPAETASYYGGKYIHATALEFIHPLQTSIGCREAQFFVDYDTLNTVCLIGNEGSEWKFDLDSNIKKVPGSECMDGYVNDDGLCVLSPPTTTPEPTTTITEPETTVETMTSTESAETTPGSTTVIPTTPKTTPKEAVPTKPEASDEKEKEGVSVDGDASLEPGQEALESLETTRNYSYGLWILVFICLLFE